MSTIEHHEPDASEQRSRQERLTANAGALRRRGRRSGAGHSYTSPVLAYEPDRDTFITNVITNSVAPTAKIVLYSIEPVGTSPAPVAR